MPESTVNEAIERFLSQALLRSYFPRISYAREAVSNLLEMLRSNYKSRKARTLFVLEYHI